MIPSSILQTKKKKHPMNVKENLWSFCSVVIWQKAIKEVKIKVRM